MEREVKAANTSRPAKAAQAAWQTATAARVELPGAEQVRSRQRAYRGMGIALLVGVCVLGSVSMWPLAKQQSLADVIVGNQKPQALFQGWAKPDLALVVSGQQFGYLQPCGCSSPQFGGLARRYNFVQSLKDKGWPVIAVDLGDIAPRTNNPQLQLKYSTAMKSLETIGYSAVGVGKTEMNMPLASALGAHRLNNPYPKVLAATLLHPKTNGFIRGFVDGSHVITKPGLPNVGVVGLVGRSLTDAVRDPDLAFLDNGDVITGQMNHLKKEKAQICVLLYQGAFQGADKDAKKDAQVLAKYCHNNLRAKDPAIPPVQVILCSSAEDEPPGVPSTVPGVPTQIIQIGHKGRYVGVVGFYRTGRPNDPFEMKYQLVSVGPQFETPQGKEAQNPVMTLMEDYAKEVKAGNYILKYPTAPHRVQVDFPQAKYVGSERCSGCHPHAYAVWSKPHGNEKLYHANAYQTLVDAKHPSLRQHDGECIKCHVTGFEHPTGYGDALRASNQKYINLLKGVGCESCHGPGSAHVKDRLNEKIHAAMNPWRKSNEERNPATSPARRKQLETLRMRKIDYFCQKCHDIDNDVHWDFETKWPKVAHPTPVNNNAANQIGQPNPAPTAQGSDTEQESGKETRKGLGLNLLKKIRKKN